MRSYTPAARLVRIMAELIVARNEAKDLILQAQETYNTNLQREVAGIIFHTEEMIKTINGLIVNAGPLTKYASQKYRQLKNIALLLCLSSNLWAVGCATDSDCNTWNFGLETPCGNRTYCDSGVSYSCVRTYWCSLQCTGNTCNNFYKICEGECSPMAGMCDAANCGAEVCTVNGPCATCGDGNCDSGEDETNCPADCFNGGGNGGGGSTTTTTTTTTAVIGGGGGGGSTTTPPSTATIPAPPPGPIDLMIDGYIREVN